MSLQSNTFKQEFRCLNIIEKNPLDTLYEEQSEVSVEEQSDQWKETRSVSFNNIKKPAVEKHKENIDITQAEQDIESARQEWDHLESTVPVISPSVTVSSPATYEEVICYFRSKNMSQYLKIIKPVKQRRGLDVLKHWILGPGKLNPVLIPDRDLLFAIALCPFDTSDSLHMRVLQTVYKALTGTTLDCPRYGSHWEEIGFQGIDPGTDLRGVGFLGLLHLLQLILNPQTAELSKDISSLSRSVIQDFPFCVMGINITRIVLETMREEILNRECNRREDIFFVTNTFYAGIYLRLSQIWRDQRKTIMDSGYVLKDVSYYAKKNPSLIFKGLFNYNERKAKTRIHDLAKFSDIGDISQSASAVML